MRDRRQTPSRANHHRFFQRRSAWLPAALVAAAALAVATPRSADAHSDPTTDGLIEGGGSSKTDCISKFRTGLELNYPFDKTRKKELACTDGDLACDADGAVNGACGISVGICLADDDDMAATGCVPGGMSPGSVVVKTNKKSPEPDLVQLQQEVDDMIGSTGIECDDPGSPAGHCFTCTNGQAVITASMSNKKGRRKITVKAKSDPTGVKNKPVKDKDKLKLRCVDCEIDSAWEHINNIVFKQSCAIAGACHTGPAAAAGLNLDKDWNDQGLDGVYNQVVGVATTAVGGAALGMVRVLAGDPDLDTVSSSLLMEKIRLKRSDLEALCADAGQPAGCLGTEMPPGVDVFSTGKAELVKAWIAGGAPREGWPAGATCGEPEDIWLPAEPLDPPAPNEGFQLHFEAPEDFVVKPGTEFEGCQWIAVPPEITQTMYINRIELRANTGTHHIIVYDDVPDAGPPSEPTDFDPNDFGCNKNFGLSAFQLGAQDAEFEQALPPEVSFAVEPGEAFGVNMHYTNPFNVDIIPEIWVNYYGSPIPTPKTAINIFPGDIAFSIPPYTAGQGNLIKFTHRPSTPGCYWLLTSHQHRRGTGTKMWTSEPTSWDDDNDKIYDNPDWDHPIVLNPDPRLLLEEDDGFWFQCQWDNGVLNDVTRRCDNCGLANIDVCFSDDDCDSGNCVDCPLDLGLLAEDEMCFIPGFYYPADFDSDAGQWVCPY